MTQADIDYIKVSYRDAKSRRKQLGILAQLYDCTPIDIKRVLGDVICTSSPARKCKHHRYTAQQREEIGRAIVASGLTLGQAEIKYGIKRYTLAAWVLPYRPERPAER